MQGRKNRELQQRRFPRKNISTEVSYQYENRLMKKVYAGSGRTINLSMNGALIRVESYVPPQAEIDAYIIMKNGKQISTLSRVIHCHRVAFNVYEIGIQFLKVRKEK
jgi:hypothetical protein